MPICQETKSTTARERKKKISYLLFQMLMYNCKSTKNEGEGEDDLFTFKLCIQNKRVKKKDWGWGEGFRTT